MTDPLPLSTGVALQALKDLLGVVPDEFFNLGWNESCVYALITPRNSQLLFRLGYDARNFGAPMSAHLVLATRQDGRPVVEYVPVSENFRRELTWNQVLQAYNAAAAQFDTDGCQIQLPITGEPQAILTA